MFNDRLYYLERDTQQAVDSSERCHPARTRFRGLLSHRCGMALFYLVLNSNFTFPNAKFGFKEESE